MLLFRNICGHGATVAWRSLRARTEPETEKPAQPSRPSYPIITTAVLGYFFSIPLSILVSFFILAFFFVVLFIAFIGLLPVVAGAALV